MNIGRSSVFTFNVDDISEHLSFLTENIFYLSRHN